MRRKIMMRKNEEKEVHEEEEGRKMRRDMTKEDKVEERDGVLSA